MFVFVSRVTDQKVENCRVQEKPRASSSDNCYLCKKSKKRPLAAYIRSKSRSSSCKEIHEEDEETLETQEPQRGKSDRAQPVQQWNTIFLPTIITISLDYDIIISLKRFKLVPRRIFKCQIQVQSTNSIFFF